MTKIFRAEAVLTSEQQWSQDMQVAARLAGTLAAKNASSLLPLAPAGKPVKVEIETEPGEGSMRIVAAVEMETNGEAAALMAALAAALTVCDMSQGSVQSVQPIDPASAPPVHTPYPRKPAVAKPRPVRAQPLMPGAMSEPTPAPKRGVGAGPKRDALRRFMNENHLRASDWAKSAGIPVSTLYAYLTGDSSVLPKDAADKLAKAAQVRTEDMFKD